MKKLRRRHHDDIKSRGFWGGGGPWPLAHPTGTSKARRDSLTANWLDDINDITTTSDDITKYKVPSFILGDVGRARRKTVPDACPWPRLAAV